MQQPVLLRETTQVLDPKPNENFIDATIGDGGHARAIIEKIKPAGKLWGIDWDPEQIKKLEHRFNQEIKSHNLILVNDNYKNLENIVAKYHISSVSGILFDLGFSLYHIEESGRGFSFQKDEPLLMTYCGAEGQNRLTAGAIINNWPQKDLEKILKEYGEEKFFKQIAQKICEARQKNPIKTTFDLVRIIKEAVPGGYWRQSRLHPATRTFQSLRIAVNDEFGNIKAGLGQALKILNKGGRLAIISFHSGEDRIVKEFLKTEEKEGVIKILSPKFVKPSPEEIEKNPSSRSAKLRAAVKI